MATTGVTVSHAVEQPEPRQATAEEASLLGVQKAARARHAHPADVLQRPGAARGDGGHRGARRALRVVYEIPINRRPTIDSKPATR